MQGIHIACSHSTTCSNFDSSTAKIIRLLEAGSRSPSRLLFRRHCFHLSCYTSLQMLNLTFNYVFKMKTTWGLLLTLNFINLYNVHIFVTHHCYWPLDKCFYIIVSSPFLFLLLLSFFFFFLNNKLLRNDRLRSNK